MLVPESLDTNKIPSTVVFVCNVSKPMLVFLWLFHKLRSFVVLCMNTAQVRKVHGAASWVDSSPEKTSSSDGPHQGPQPTAEMEELAAELKKREFLMVRVLRSPCSAWFWGFRERKNHGCEDQWIGL